MEEKPEKNDALSAENWPEALRRIRERTPARLLHGRAGGSYRTETQLSLREAHAAARDAVRTELRLHSVFDATFLETWKLFEVSTRASSKEEYLLRPDLGRVFNDAAREEIRAKCLSLADLQIAIGDGLSATAVAAQVPSLLPLIAAAATRRGWRLGQPFVIRHCRVGILNEIGALLSPAVVVLLIGERPGLATAESLSAYLAYRPGASHTDANRNLISNIHARGLSTEEAAEQIVRLADAMMKARLSGCELKIDTHSLQRSADQRAIARASQE
jgi:ethanolamine ammonia-lyase small subunit